MVSKNCRAFANILLVIWLICVCLVTAAFQWGWAAGTMYSLTMVGLSTGFLHYFVQPRTEPRLTFLGLDAPGVVLIATLAIFGRTLFPSDISRPVIDGITMLAVMAFVLWVALLVARGIKMTKNENRAGKESKG